MQIKDLRILVVDDNVYKLMSIKRALEYNGVTMITTVNNQEDVFSELAIPGAHYDVIVTDMQYPLTSGSSVNCDAGYILIDRLKEQKIDIPVIICSSDNVSPGDAIGTVWYNGLRELEYDMYEQLLYVVSLVDER